MWRLSPEDTIVVSCGLPGGASLGRSDFGMVTRTPTPLPRYFQGTLFCHDPSKTVCVDWWTGLHVSAGRSKQTDWCVSPNLGHGYIGQCACSCVLPLATRALPPVAQKAHRGNHLPQTIACHLHHHLRQRRRGSAPTCDRIMLPMNHVLLPPYCAITTSACKMAVSNNDINMLQPSPVFDRL
jgi:hypothetical protein